MNNIFLWWIFACVLLATTAARASAQLEPGPAAQRALEAYAQGDYRTAAPVLRAYVLRESPQSGDPWAAYTLGLMNLRGLGMPRDYVLGCALVRMAEAEFMWRGGRLLRNPAMPMVEQALNSHCVGLTPAEHEEMGSLMGCYRDGPPAAVVDLTPGHWVMVDRIKIQVEYQGRAIVAEFQPQCQTVYFPVLYARVAHPNPQAVPAIRHCLEFFGWQVGGDADTGAFSTQTSWAVYEIRRDSASLVHLEPLSRFPGATYPDRGAHERLRKLTRLQLEAGGKIEALVLTEPVRRTIIE